VKGERIMQTQARFSRRDLIKLAASGAAVTSLAGCASMAGPPLGRVVVVGGGYGGATAAKYLRLWGEGRIDVTLVEPSENFVSCPMSNLVIGGSKTMKDITIPYAGLSKYGVKVVRDTAARIDTDKRQVVLASGGTLGYDRLVLATGIEFMFEQVRGMSAAATQTIPHAWRAGAQTQLLRDQLVAMRDGGTVVMSIPLAPYRCPPGPYERACQIAHYLKTAKPRSKLVVLDANPDLVSKKGLFLSVWNNDYKGLIDYRVNSPVSEVDVAGRQFVLELGDKVGGDVLNLIPPQRAANIARDSGVITANDAQVGPHGQSAWQGRGRRHRRADERPCADPADDGQHLLQLRRRRQRRAREQRAPLGAGEEDDGDRARLRRPVAGGAHALGVGRRVRLGLGAADLGRHAGLSAAAAPRPRAARRFLSTAPRCAGRASAARPSADRCARASRPVPRPRLRAPPAR